MNDHTHAACGQPYGRDKDGSPGQMADNITRTRTRAGETP